MKWIISVGINRKPLITLKLVDGAAILSVLPMETANYKEEALRNIRPPAMTPKVCMIA
jgi:hypothetical protein